MLICPWSAGGGTDRVSRQIAVQLEQELGVPVNVVNATGGGGVTGHTRGALAPADGYTLTMITVELNMLHWRGLTNINYQNFRPLLLLNRDDAALFVRQDAPYQNVGELLAAIRDRAGRDKLKASGTAQGGIWHVAVAGWLNQEQVSPDAVNWISINGAAPSLQELMASGVDFVCCSIPEAQSLIDAGKVRGLGLMADERLSSAPNVPTFREQQSDWSLGGWRGLAVPRDVPAERVEVLSAALDRIAASDEFRRFMDQAGFNVSIADGPQFAERLADWDQQFGVTLNSPAFKSVQQARYGPMLFPKLLLGLGVILLGAMLSARFRSGKITPAGSEIDPATPAPVPLSGHALVRLAIVPAWVVIYSLLAPTVGFIVTAALLLSITMFTLGVRPMPALLTTLVTVPAVYELFAVYLRVPLPWGLIGW